ncbi:MAG: hypothetical protein ABIO62_14520, partial [Paracoccaceae bacterium]
MKHKTRALGNAIHLLAGNHYTASCGHLQPGRECQSGGFSAARRADTRAKLAGLDHQIYVVDRGHGCA